MHLTPLIIKKTVLAAFPTFNYIRKKKRMESALKVVAYNLSTNHSFDLASKIINLLIIRDKYNTLFFLL